MEDKESHDASVTWALGRLEAADGTSAGALIVGFDMRRVNSEIRSRYVKAAGVVLFFVALIVFRTVGLDAPRSECPSSHSRAGARSRRSIRRIGLELKE
jgi:hypothetical protein